MSSFDWLEFETLTRDLSDFEDRLAAARARKNHGLMRLLEQQVADARKRRERALEAITRHTASTAAKPAPRLKAVESGPLPEIRAANDVAAAEKVIAAKGGAKEPAAPRPTPAPVADRIEGDSTVWDQLTPEHLEEAKRELTRRRDEILARHAEELKALDTDQAEIDALDQAIAAFSRKFGNRAEPAEIVRLDQERGARVHGND